MWILILALIIADQISKHFLTTIINSGAAFGILKNFNVPLLVFSLIALVICIYFYFKNKKIRLPLTFLISGIIGNSMDRILFGHVRDFINVGFFPVFNLADSFNFIGIVLLIILLWKR